MKTVSGKVVLGTTGAGHGVGAHGVGQGRDPRAARRAARDAAASRSADRSQCDCDAGDDGEIAVASVSGDDQGVERVMDAITGAIVFTDIVGFTQLTDKHGDDVALALARTAGEDGARRAARAARAS